jgi:hypothetical protein
MKFFAQLFNKRDKYLVSYLIDREKRQKALKNTIIKNKLEAIYYEFTVDNKLFNKK